MQDEASCQIVSKFFMLLLAFLDVLRSSKVSFCFGEKYAKTYADRKQVN